MEPKTHTILSASSSHRWLACPGSIRMSAGIEPKTSAYAKEGTAAHNVADMCFRSGKNASAFLGNTILVESETFKVNEEMVKAVQEYIDVVRNDYFAGTGSSLFYEKRFKLTWLRPDMWGTNDAMVSDASGLLRIYDFKYGKGVVVEVEDNPQTMYYGVGAVGPSGRGFKEVEFIIVQPRAFHPDGTVRRCRMSVASLLTWAKEVLLPGANATEDPNAPIVVGKHCQFCPALAICGAQKDQAHAVAKMVFAERSSAPPAPAVLSVKELRKILDVADMVTAWFDACRRHVRALLDTGRTTSAEVGYKFVAGRSSRAWIDEKEAEKWLLSLIDDEAYTPRTLISPAQAEKILTGKTAKEAIATLVKKTEDGKQLVPVSDKRPSIESAITAFSAIPEEFL